jgi:uncharacterized membrane protein YphA (DoxX/SURF4 family)
MAAILQWGCRLFVGGLFVFAGFSKLGHPFEFEMAIESYQILPVWGVIAVARMLPSLEVLLGVLLLIGWKLHWFSSIATALLAFFLATMAITYSRGVEATCGCFGMGEPVSPRTLLRDTLFLLPAIYLSVVAWRQHRRRRLGRASTEPLAFSKPV